MRVRKKESEREKDRERDWWSKAAENMKAKN
jgi:hypothetical protein